jgi:GT2 family glycosyltransferase
MSNTEMNPHAPPPVMNYVEAPTLAVMIPTLNRPHDLTLAVRTLLAQTRLPQELIIVDQSPGDESERQVRALFAEQATEAAQIELRYTRDRQINGLTMARNVALDQNRCDIVLFLDDDVELEPQFVEKLLESYGENAGVTGISGIITNYRPGGFATRTWQWLFVRGPFRDERQSIYHAADRLRGGGRIAVSRFGGGLMSFRADRIAGMRFDENLRGACEGEDVDFCMHLPEGARLEIDPRARLVHNASPEGRQNEHWIASVVRGNSYLYYRNWRNGWRNAAAFTWLMTGFALLALLASLKRRSPAPWKAFSSAIRGGRNLGLGRKQG